MTERHPWAEDVSKGDLRRLAQHTKEARDRLDKATQILEENGVELHTGEHGFEWVITEAASCAGDTASECRNAYAERREADGE